MVVLGKGSATAQFEQLPSYRRCCNRMPRGAGSTKKTCHFKSLLAPFFRSLLHPLRQTFALQRALEVTGSQFMSSNINPTIQDIIPLLERIALAQERLSQSPTVEGFLDYGPKIFANVTRGNGDGWYTINDGVATTQKSIFRGRLVGIDFPTVKRREQDVRKFHLVMRSGLEVVTFESGYDCFFSKTVLAAFAIASPLALRGTIQLASYPKTLTTGDQTLAVSLRDIDGNKLPSEWTNDDDWKAIATAAMANAKAAAGSL